VILQSASSCPACKKHLKFEPGAAATPAPSFSALSLEGAVRHPNVGQAWEYSVLVSIKNEAGEEVARQVVNVGALQPGEQRSFTFAVDVFVPGDAKPTTAGATVDSPVSSPVIPVAASAAASPSLTASVPSGTRPGAPPPSVPSGTRPSTTPSVPSGTRPPGTASVPSGTRPKR
jgi:hypothetical protein